MRRSLASDPEDSTLVDLTKATSHDRLSLSELALYHDITAYRSGLGLAPLPLSKALTATAGRHVLDTRENIWAADLDLPGGTNLHSWSDAPYYADNRAPEAMWEAPARLGTGYPSSGYEISAAGYSDGAAALAAWKTSPGHDAVLTSSGTWASTEFRAIGVGLETAAGEGPYDGLIYHVWFGAAPDPTGVPTIAGTGRGDRVGGTAFRDRIDGRDGDDRISGRAGDDRLWGRDGADQLSGGNGDDRLYGGSGNDRLAGGDGRDRLYGDAGRDRLLGGDGDDALRGGSGDDRLAGHGGRDDLRGGSGDDTLEGGGGADRIDGGAGRDVLTGDAAADVFVFASARHSGSGSARDLITDFERGLDRIDLRGIDADPGSRGGQAFDFIGRTAFSETAGELRVTRELVSADLTGDGRADLQVEIADVAGLRADDFLL